MSDETTPQDGKAMSPASTGSVDEPVAWWFKCNEYESVTLLRERADAMAGPYGTTPIPLYRSPTLTGDERAAVAIAVNMLTEAGWGTSTLRGLLERTR